MSYIAQPLPITRCGRMSLLGARLSSLRNELLLQCRASRREKKGKPNTTEHLSNSAQCVVITSKIQAIFPTYNNKYHFAAKDLFRNDFFWCKASMLEFRIISSINKEISKFYDTLFRNLF